MTPARLAAIALSFAAVTALLVWGLFPSPPVADEDAETARDEAPAEAMAEALPLPGEIKPLPTLVPEQLPTPEELERAHPAGPSPTLWRSVSAAEVSMPRPDAKVEEAMPVALDEAHLGSVQPGEQVTLPLPGGGEAQVVVESRKRSESGSISWVGRLQGVEGNYPVVYTQGRDSAFASIMTPTTTYSLESVKGRGWIYRNPEIHNLAPDGSPDFKIPAHTH